MKKAYSTWLVLVVAVTTSLQAQPAAESFFDQKKREVICAEPLPNFTLGEKSKPTDQQVKELCSCIWSSFPKDGWEQRTSQLIRNNQDPGWRGRAFAARFGDAMKACNGMNF
jgi:hypothetical protein